MHRSVLQAWRRIRQKQEIEHHREKMESKRIRDAEKRERMANQAGGSKKKRADDDDASPREHEDDDAAQAHGSIRRFVMEELTKVRGL